MGFLEWMRLHPQKSRHYFDAMRGSAMFGKTYKGYYEMTRILVARTKNKLPEGAPDTKAHI